MSELQTMESKLAEMGHRAMGAESELLEAREKIEHLEKLLAKARGAGKSKGKSPAGSTEAERELIKAREVARQLRAKIVELEDAAGDKSDADLRVLEDEISDLRDQLEGKDSELGRLEEQLGEAEEALEKAELQLENLRAEVDPERWECERERMRDRIVEAAFAGKPFPLSRGDAERLINLDLYEAKVRASRESAITNI